VDRNLKYVGQEPKIYVSVIISKTNLKGRIVLSLPLNSLFDYSDRCLASPIGAPANRTAPSRSNTSTCTSHAISSFYCF